MPAACFNGLSPCCSLFLTSAPLLLSNPRCLAVPSPLFSLFLPFPSFVGDTVKVKAYDLQKKNKKELLEQLDGLKKELASVRFPLCHC